MTGTAPPSPLTHALAPNRACGDCVACCYVLAIEALKKPAGVMCRHCTGAQCGIYEERPPACRAYFCLWRRIAALPDELRPKDCGVMFSVQYGEDPTTIFESMYILATAIDDPTALDRPLVKGAIEMFGAQGGLPVFVGFRGTSFRVYPDHALADAILHPETTRHRELLGAAAEWRKRRGLPPSP
jgi:hypothetical protein